MSLYFVGIDISKSKHDCCIISAADQQAVSKFTFKNDKDGFSELLAALHSLSSPEDIRIGFEFTAHYALNLDSFLRKPTTALWKLIQSSFLSTRSQLLSAERRRTVSIANRSPVG